MFKFTIVKFPFDAERKIDSTESSTIRRFLYRFFSLTENAFFFLLFFYTNVHVCRNIHMRVIYVNI